MSPEQTIGNGYTQWNVATVIIRTRQMDPIFGSESVPSVKEENRDFRNGCLSFSFFQVKRM